MSSKLTIELNFLPVKGEFPQFEVYTCERKVEDAKPSPELIGTSLPSVSEDGQRDSCWVSFEERLGWDRRIVSPSENLMLCNRAMLYGLEQAATRALTPDDFEVVGGGVDRYLTFKMVRHREGVEGLKVQPYLLKKNGSFGWLTDFQFKQEYGVPFSRRIQQLSLSLNRHFKKNLNCYLDRVNKIDQFLGERFEVLKDVTLPGNSGTLSVDSNRAHLQARRLRTKIYLFTNERTDRGQFTGLKRFGPFERTTQSPHLVFAFREQDRIHARKLALALKGTDSSTRYNFQGFEKLFQSEMTISGDPIVLRDTSSASYDTALENFERRLGNYPNAIPIFVLPKRDDNGYLSLKSTFASKEISTQVCTTDLIQDDYGLKWAIANIALQIFCKSGGKPWRVRPTSKRALIVGISQSYKVTKTAEGDSEIERYFSFSVLTDNSGVFQEICVLGDSAEQGTYIEQLSKNLDLVLRQKGEEFDRVVIHTSFRPKAIEMNVIKDTVENAAKDKGSGKFAIIKVNNKTRFFGTNPEVNSKVPFEGTTVSLGGGQHLLWFEGIYPDKKTVNKPFSGPTHVEFLRFDGAAEDQDEMLQDLVNLSGANWRGFNAKAAPVSVFYCHLVAKLVRNMHSLGLPIPNIKNIQPWFL